MAWTSDQDLPNRGPPAASSASFDTWRRISCPETSYGAASLASALRADMAPKQFSGAKDLPSAARGGNIHSSTTERTKVSFRPDAVTPLRRRSLRSQSQC
jgi:hypothetical protein